MMYVPIVFEPSYADMITGIWCDDCRLPSVVRIPMLMMSGDGICPAGDLITCVKCDDLIEDGDDGGQLVGG